MSSSHEDGNRSDMDSGDEQEDRSLNNSDQDDADDDEKAKTKDRPLEPGTIEEEKKSDGDGKVKIPSHLQQAAPAAKPAWMLKLASGKRPGAGGSVRRAGYAIKSVEDVVPSGKSTENAQEEAPKSAPKSYQPGGGTVRRAGYKIKAVYDVPPPTPTEDKAAEEGTSSALFPESNNPKSPNAEASIDTDKSPERLPRKISSIQKPTSQSSVAGVDGKIPSGGSIASDHSLSRSPQSHISKSSNSKLSESLQRLRLLRSQHVETKEPLQDHGGRGADKDALKETQESSDSKLLSLGGSSDADIFYEDKSDGNEENEDEHSVHEEKSIQEEAISDDEHTGAGSGDEDELHQEEEDISDEDEEKSEDDQVDNSQESQHEMPSQEEEIAPSQPVPPSNDDSVESFSFAPPRKSDNVESNGIGKMSSMAPSEEDDPEFKPASLETFAPPRPTFVAPKYVKTKDESGRREKVQSFPPPPSDRKLLPISVLPSPPSICDSDDNDIDDDWMVPRRQDDDSSWVNPYHPVSTERKQHLVDELRKTSVDLFPEDGELSEHVQKLRAIDEEGKLGDLEYDARVGLIVPNGIHGDGQTVSETSFSDASRMDASAKVIESSIPNKKIDVWALPSQEGSTYRAAGKLQEHKDGKDYRFSYIAQQHTHSTSSYADVVRERYFPKEDNEYWAAPVKESTPELTLHIARNGTVKSGPPDESETWMPPEKGSEAPVDVRKYYGPTLAEEKKYEDARSVITDGSDWVGRPSSDKSVRIDFSGELKQTKAPEDSFDWNPSKVPSNPDDSESEESESMPVAAIKTERAPRPPSPPAKLDRSLPKEPSETFVHKFDYSPSGRLKFDMQPTTIMIPDEERGDPANRRRAENYKKAQNRRLCLISACFFLILIPAAVFLILHFALDLFDTRNNIDEPTPPSPITTPTLSPTLPPAASPEQPSPGDSEDILIEFLSNVSSDAGAALQDSRTPQFAAMRWLRSAANRGIYNDAVFIQRYALATLYYATNGQGWTSSQAWMTNESECEWFSAASQQTICDSNGRLLQLTLNGNNLSGSIPPELGLLSNLRTINLSQNRLQGTIPRTIGGLSSLVTLFLFGNSLQSVIPTELGNLGELVELDIGANQLVGTIPTQLGQLGSLESLALFGNQLSGFIPSELAQLRLLRVLFLDANSFRPVLPAEICDSLDLDDFWTDCDEIEGCSCCTKCCQDGVPC